jgi:hypothetical protein
MNCDPCVTLISLTPADSSATWPPRESLFHRTVPLTQLQERCAWRFASLFCHRHGRKDQETGLESSWLGSSNSTTRSALYSYLQLSHFKLQKTIRKLLTNNFLATSNSNHSVQNKSREPLEPHGHEDSKSVSKTFLRCLWSKQQWKMSCNTFFCSLWRGALWDICVTQS